MELFFIRELAAEPVGVGGGFGVADVNRPVERKANFFEHAPRHPDITVAAPECGMFDSCGFFPCPTFVRPERTRLVTSGLQEAEKVAVCDIVTFNGKCRNKDDTFAAFIVPAEDVPVRAAKSRLTGRDFHEVVV